MKNRPSFSLRARRRSFVFAGEGLRRFFRQEHNAWIHASATLLVTGLAWLLPVTPIEAAVLAIAAGIVWVAEIINTAVEKIMDFISVEKRPAIKYIKDLSAAAVLVASLAAVIAAALIFLPKLL